MIEGIYFGRLSFRATCVVVYILQIGFRILQMFSLFLRETKVSFNFSQNPKTNLVTVYNAD